MIRSTETRRPVLPRLVATALLFLVAGAAPAVIVSFRAPAAGQPAFGEVTVEVEVLSLEPVVSVELRVDGRAAALLTEPPYRTVVDLGPGNRPHTIEATATDATGARDTRVLTTGVVPIHDEIDLDLQQLYVTATRDGGRVLDLAADRFRVRDEGETQELVTFERGDVPLTAVLLVDSSLSMEGDALRAALAGVEAFVAGMAELDEAKVMVFSDRLLAATPFTADPAVVAAVADRVAPSGSTSINDHLYLALQELARRQGRRVIVLLSDGLDIDSILRMADVEWKAGRVQGVIYWIRPMAGADPGRRGTSVWRDAAAQAREVEGLERAVRSSGGRVIGISRVSEAPAAFREVLRELRDQYVLGYYPSIDRDDGAWHDVEVRVDAPGVAVRARGGYYDDEH